MNEINAVGVRQAYEIANSRLALRLNGFAEALVGCVEKREVWFLAGFSILYLAVTCLVAAQKPLWNDELYTLYIVRLPGVSDVWAALSTGAEQIPPFFYVLTRASLAFYNTREEIDALAAGIERVKEVFA